MPQSEREPQASQEPLAEPATPPAAEAAPPPAAEPEEPPAVAGFRVLEVLEPAASGAARFAVLAPAPSGPGAPPASSEPAAPPATALLILHPAGVAHREGLLAKLRALDPAHAARLFDWGVDGDRAWELWERLPLGSLAAHRGAEPWPPEAVEALVREVAAALSHTGERGVVEVDLAPDAIALRSREPLDLVLTGFSTVAALPAGAGRAPPLAPAAPAARPAPTAPAAAAAPAAPPGASAPSPARPSVSAYAAPESFVGAETEASAWWSLGVVVLERLLGRSPLAGVHGQALALHLVTRGVDIPQDVGDPGLRELLEGLLTRAPERRWGAAEVGRWLAGERGIPTAYERARAEVERAPFTLGGRAHRTAEGLALDAALAERWDEAARALESGALATWAREGGLDPARLERFQAIAADRALEGDARLQLALLVLNPELPLCLRGEVITPDWLPAHPAEADALLAGPLPPWLRRLERETWLADLAERGARVREALAQMDIAFDAERLRALARIARRAPLEAAWAERRLRLPEALEPRLAWMAERERPTDDDLVALLAASDACFTPAAALLDAALAEAGAAGLEVERGALEALLARPRRELLRALKQRVDGFARAGLPLVDEWADAFREERRIATPRLLLLLSVPAERWQAPEEQTYLARLFAYFHRRITRGIQRGGLLNAQVSRSARRVDLAALATSRAGRDRVLKHLTLRRPDRLVIEPQKGEERERALAKLRGVLRQARLYQRETGIPPLHVGFPLVTVRDPSPTATTRPKLCPLFLWPVELDQQPLAEGRVSIGFDRARGRVELNPALESLLPGTVWEALEALLDELESAGGADPVTVVADAATALAPLLAEPSGERAKMETVPDPVPEVERGQARLAFAAVIFLCDFASQTVANDVRRLAHQDLAGGALPALLRLPAARAGANADGPAAGADAGADAGGVGAGGVAVDEVGARPLGAPGSRRARIAERDRYFVAASDPSQSAAVLAARERPGVLVQGPPGTGKSQTIVNAVIDTVARGGQVLIVCQKQAAIDVVAKRLVAEGLGDLLLSIRDPERQRRDVIERLKAQLAAPRARSETAERRREELAARIERLEGELDAYASALARPIGDSRLSLGDVLEELIRIRAEAPPRIAVPALRPLLAGLSVEAVRELRTALPPLAPVWREARYEGSPLAGLRPFHPDDEALAAREAALAALERAEVARAAHLDALPAAERIDLASDDDADALARWLAASCGALRGLPAPVREALARWAELFAARAPGAEAEAEAEPGAGASAAASAAASAGAPAASAGAALAARLDALCRAVEGAERPSHYDALFGVFAGLSKAALARLDESWLDHERLRGRWWRFFSPNWRQAQAALAAPFAGRPVPFDAATAGEHLAHQRALRAARAELAEVLAALDGPGARRPPEDDLASVGVEAASRLGLLRAIEPLAPAVLACPARAALVEALAGAGGGAGAGARAPVTASAGAPAGTAAPSTGGHDASSAANASAAPPAAGGDPVAAFARRAGAALERRRLVRASLAALDGFAPFLEDAPAASLRAAIESHEPGAERIAALRAAWPTLPAYQRFAARLPALPAGAAALFAALGGARAALAPLPDHELVEEVARALWREAHEAWRARAERDEPALLTTSEELARRADELGRADAEMRQANRAFVQGVAARAEVAPESAWRELLPLTGPRSKRLRQIVDGGERLGLYALRPVWLANPETVSQIFPLRAGLFDLVIFDEASQLPVELAIPCLHRGRRALVSGDDKQMPPTSFFSSSAGLDDEAEDELEAAGQRADEAPADEAAQALHERVASQVEIMDCEDLLALGGLTLPPALLDTHYRSRYAHLIGFSNQAYYQGRLNVPVAHPEPELRRIQPIRVEPVGGVYAGRQNPAEADRVVHLLAELWRRPPADVPTLGVVTFNIQQAELIEERLEARALADPAFAEAYEREARRASPSGEDVGFFVKNLENVQGDERDWIVFSTTFGRDPGGRFLRSFGPLGQRGGERRLNVAVTRARERMVIFTSMPVEEIADGLGQGPAEQARMTPRHFLQLYLQYAAQVSSGAYDRARGVLEQVGRLCGRAEPPRRGEGHRFFAEEVARVVEGLGYEVVRGGGEGAFAVDLAVADPRTGLFGLAIECDPPRHPTLAEARARELWRPAVLRLAIPALHRVWSRDWLAARDREVARLRAALARLTPR